MEETLPVGRAFFICISFVAQDTEKFGDFGGKLYSFYCYDNV